MSGRAVVRTAVPSVLRCFDHVHNVATLCIKEKDSVNEVDANEGNQGTENANDQNQGYVGQLNGIRPFRARVDDRPTD